MTIKTAQLEAAVYSAAVIFRSQQARLGAGNHDALAERVAHRARILDATLADSQICEYVAGALNKLTRPAPVNGSDYTVETLLGYLRPYVSPDDAESFDLKTFAAVLAERVAAEAAQSPDPFAEPEDWDGSRPLA